jgi:hypothetical protein
VLPPEERPTLLAHDPRAAIEEARRRHLARSGGASRVESESGDDRRAGNTGSGQSRPSQEVPPVRVDEVSREFPRLTSFPEEEQQFTTVPTVVDGITLPRPEPKKVERLVAGHETDDPEIIPSTRMPSTRFKRVDPNSRVQVTAALGVTDDGDEQDFALEDDYASFVEASEPVPAEALPRSEQAAYIEERRTRGWLNRFVADSRGRSQPPPEPDYGEEEVDVPHWQAETDEVYVDPNLGLTDPEREADFDIRDELYDVFEDDDLDPPLEFAPDIPRMCRTCRDFRPADSGERGWCNNTWAFSHRRMVGADELPCESSLGCWWLPHDDVWLTAADATNHSQPTPLVDEWLARREVARRRQGT